MKFQGNEESDERVLREFWHGKDLYPDIKDTRLKFIELTGKMYDEQVVDPQTGKFVSDRPWFIQFIQPQHQYCQMMKDSLQHLAHHFNGSIQFAWVNINKEELLQLSFDAYIAPRSNYIHSNGISYAFDPIITGKPQTIKWLSTE